MMHGGNLKVQKKIKKKHNMYVRCTEKLQYEVVWL